MGQCYHLCESRFVNSDELDTWAVFSVVGGCARPSPLDEKKDITSGSPSNFPDLCPTGPNVHIEVPGPYFESNAGLLHDV